MRTPPPVCLENLHFPQVTPLIARIYTNYPLSLHRNEIQQIVDDVITEQVVKRHVTGPQTKPVLVKKDLKGMGIQLRLQSLQSKGVLAVAQRLSGHLRQIKHDEKEAAKTNRNKAAAQNRFILPGVEDRTVKSLCQWTYYQGNLIYEDTKHL
jgi:hypothetical protein